MIKNILFVISFLISYSSFAQTNKDCLECHSDKSITMEKSGKTISLFLDNDKFLKSKHKDMSCVDCHAGFDANNVPHKEKIEEVNCLNCHESKGIEKSVHAKGAKCYSCHSKHNIQSANSVYSDVDACLKCHNESSITGYKNTKHSKLIGSKRQVSCNTCHGTIHTLTSKTNPSSPVNSSKIASLCTKCHTATKLANSIIHKTIITGTDENAKNCKNCHNAHSVVLNKSFSGSKGCLSCHMNKDMFKDKKGGANNTLLTSLVEQYTHSIHAKAQANGKEAASCADCHGDHIADPKLNPKQATQKENQPQTCGKCHKYVSQEFQSSGHGTALKGKIKGAPACSDCHTEHGITLVNDPKASIGRLEEVKVCLKCHLNNPDVQKVVNPSAKFIESYEKSAHGLAYLKGNTKAAICSDCHGSHSMKKASDPTSLVNIKQISKTCSKCHAEISKVYTESIHGVSYLRGKDESPVCITCHGEHSILSHFDPSSPSANENVSTKICGSCHNSVSLNNKYDLSGKKFASYQDSYHGLATTSGDMKAANCASCHGVHNIKQSTDSTSTIYKANLAKTCGKCHPGANENFTKGSIHTMKNDKDDPLLSFISSTYIFLIIFTIGGMLFHNVIDFYRKAKTKLKRRRYQYEHHKFGSALYLRMSVAERIQHIALLTSFITLSVTGFMLAYPNAWWVVPIRNLWEGFYQVRGLLHRIAAVVMTLASMYHIYYVMFVPRGKQLIKDLLPKIQDLYDAIGIMKYNLGFSKVKPKLDRFSYIEKAEYWALIWGTVVMAVTGFMLWFFDYFLGITSKLALDAATAIHYYEAWLATLAIVVWHFYFVMLNPDTYPMNLAWIFGTVSEEEMYEEHPLELERIKLKEHEDYEAQDSENN